MERAFLDGATDFNSDQPEALGQLSVLRDAVLGVVVNYGGNPSVSQPISQFASRLRNEEDIARMYRR